MRGSLTVAVADPAIPLSTTTATAAAAAVRIADFLSRFIIYSFFLFWPRQ
jgi:hypothetical protein